MSIEYLKNHVEKPEKKAAEGLVKKVAQAAFDKKDAPAEAPAEKKPEKTVDEIAREVIQGLWGSGAERKTRLTESGYDYDAVQKRVNELFK